MVRRVLNPPRPLAVDPCRPPELLHASDYGRRTRLLAYTLHLHLPHNKGTDAPTMAQAKSPTRAAFGTIP